jgi:hypothetical protein
MLADPCASHLYLENYGKDWRALGVNDGRLVAGLVDFVEDVEIFGSVGALGELYCHTQLNHESKSLQRPAKGISDRPLEVAVFKVYRLENFYP